MSRWLNGKVAVPLRASTRKPLERFVSFHMKPDAMDASGHLVVRESGDIGYDPASDPTASVAADVEAILAWLPPDMSRRFTSEVTTKARLAQVYAYGGSQGWSKERLAFIHSTIERLEAL